MKDYKYYEYYTLGRFRETIECNTTKFYIKVNNADPFDNNVHLMAEETLDYTWHLWASNNEIFNDISPKTVKVSRNDVRFIMETNDDDMVRLFVISLLKKNNNDK
jgi:hypothetical protein